jgi:hypothetical protein
LNQTAMAGRGCRERQKNLFVNDYAEMKTFLGAGPAHGARIRFAAHKFAPDVGVEGRAA